MHRDISAGNILIDVDASHKAATDTGEPEDIVSKDRDPQNASGFMSDWGFAWFPRSVLDVDTARAGSQPVEPDESMKVTPGDMMIVSTESLLAYK